jgi:hypothetical protein
MNVLDCALCQQLLGCARLKETTRRVSSSYVFSRGLKLVACLTTCHRYVPPNGCFFGIELVHSRDDLPGTYRSIAASFSLRFDMTATQVQG